jgi:hypothetical protein
MMGMINLNKALTPEKRELLKSFESHLTSRKLSDNTKDSYMHAISCYLGEHDITQTDLLLYKEELMGKYAAQTVNLIITAVNGFLGMLGEEKLRLKQVKAQAKPFLENVISDEDYRFLKDSLKRDGNMRWYFIPNPQEL